MEAQIGSKVTFTGFVRHLEELDEDYEKLEEGNTYTISKIDPTTEKGFSNEKLQVYHLEENSGVTIFSDEVKLI